MEVKSSKTPVVAGIIFRCGFKDVDEIKDFIIQDKEGQIVFIEIAPPFERLWIKKGDNNEEGR